MRPTYDSNHFRRGEAYLGETLQDRRNIVEWLRDQTRGGCRDRLGTAHEEGNARRARTLHETHSPGELDA